MKNSFITLGPSDRSSCSDSSPFIVLGISPKQYSAQFEMDLFA